MNRTNAPRPGILAAVIALSFVLLSGSLAEARGGGRGGGGRGGGFSRSGPASSGGFSKRPSTPSTRPATPSQRPATPSQLPANPVGPAVPVAHVRHPPRNFRRAREPGLAGRAAQAGLVALAEREAWAELVESEA